MGNILLLGVAHSLSIRYDGSDKVFLVERKEQGRVIWELRKS